ncbi:hypothetical protein HX017_10240 [Myroides marinus]|uniref:hypothetical protein n=1 Tax=Myroides marinus TaxID=703342 RepID=UPI002578C7FB|nr:hypothetical protein [Myroides marinus]MDM1348000.1 hypothetical protein [Myroides marinus]MDM1350751.1 hypothetical protein [Myroides marinus]MDM1354539.1 hypothetical protein [Myroides marinus]MDM1357958.1 hypothetical protein [Myroides marinus]MDM1365325.1 hypothetical protein [Myroides marinus]
MKRLLFLLFMCASTMVSAQITDTAVNKDKFEKSDFPYKGDRVLIVDRIDGSKEENIFVFAKNKKGSEQDRLYIQQFTKVDGKWKSKVSEEVADEGIITVTYNNRKAFKDVEKNGQVDALYIYAKHDKDDLNNPNEEIGLLFYKYQLYTVTVRADSDFKKNYFSDNFKELPTSVKDFVLDYWNKYVSNGRR